MSIDDEIAWPSQESREAYVNGRGDALADAIDAVKELIKDAKDAIADSPDSASAAVFEDDVAAYHRVIGRLRRLAKRKSK